MDPVRVLTRTVLKAWGLGAMPKKAARTPALVPSACRPAALGKDLAHLNSPPARLSDIVGL